MLIIKNFKSNVTVERLVLLFDIRQLLGSNLGPGTRHPF
jgi:hypothetical protein